MPRSLSRSVPVDEFKYEGRAKHVTIDDVPEVSPTLSERDIVENYAHKYNSQHGMGYVSDKEVIKNMRGFVVLEKFLRKRGIKSWKGITRAEREDLRGQYDHKLGTFTSESKFGRVLSRHILKRQLPVNIISFKHPKSGT